MRADRRKIEIARGRSCKSAAELVRESGLAQSTFNRAMRGEDVKPETIGKIACALGVDVLEILVDEEKR